MKTPNRFYAAAFLLVAILVPASSANAQFSWDSQYGAAATRHCQTDYDHRPHTYDTYSGSYFCPGGPHQHYYSRRSTYQARRVRDPLVAQVQAILVQKDIYHHRHHNQVDGIYGEETRHAVEDFQRLAGLPVTGMLDGETLEALGVHGVANGQPGPSSNAPRAQVPAPYPNRPAGTPFGPPSPTNLVPVPPVTDEPSTSVEVLTPYDVAQLLKVTEEDVIELLRSGELAGRMVGTHWRITRSAVEDLFSASAKEKDTDGHDHDEKNATEKPCMGPMTPGAPASNSRRSVVR